MAKKQTRSTSTKKVVVEQNQEMVLEEPVVVKTKTQKLKKDDWEIRDRVYYLMGNKKPISRMIKSANLYWFDEEKGYEREIKYCENQKTPFVDEMKGDQRLSHIIFRNGVLYVEKTKTVLQKFLSMYHPDNGSLFYEFEPVKEAVNEIERLELEADAILAARNMDIDMAEAVMRVELGSKVSEMSSKELKRDLLLFARNNPDLLLELINDDNVQLRNYGIKATELGIIKLSNDQRTFKWGSNDRKLMTVPFDEHPYSALAAWFKTDEGMEIYSNIEKQIK